MKAIRNKGSNTGKRARWKNVRHPRYRFLVSNEAPPSWETNRNLSRRCLRFSVLPSYRCLILFLTNFPILYVFRCLILFLTKQLCFVYIPSSVFPQNGFSLVKLIVDLSIYIRVLAVFELYFIIKYNVFNKYIIYATTTAINICKQYFTLVKGR